MKIQVLPSRKSVLSKLNSANKPKLEKKKTPNKYEHTAIYVWETGGSCSSTHFAFLEKVGRPARQPRRRVHGLDAQSLVLRCYVGLVSQVVKAGRRSVCPWARSISAQGNKTPQHTHTHTHTPRDSLAPMCKKALCRGKGARSGLSGNFHARRSCRLEGRSGRGAV
uniref:Uncharacterized protein n=1 Tax=Rousettus aegyptiacus TaxID=9407 RepID=A0A7J8B8D1_ROUAE|nr:hypothetical protein HJG63_010041 [Rousettus aegyptiacus]